MFNTQPQYRNATMYGNKSMQIRKMIIQQTGTYGQQYHRPFNSNMDGRMLNTIMENVDKQKKIQASALTGIANQFLHPSATPESQIAIPNGWNEKRLRFFLEVVTTSHIGSELTEYVVGYTDYMGLASGLALDPQMRFCINAINTTRSMTQHTPLGDMRYQNVIDSSHVLTNSQYTGITGYNQMYRMRPEDVFIEMDVKALRDEAAHNDFQDGRTLLTNQPIKSRRNNAIAPVYAASILDSYLQSARSESYGESQNEILNNAMAAVASDKATADPFLSFIKGRNQAFPNTFTYADLVAMDSNVTNVTAVVDVGPTQKSTMHTAGMTEDWGGSNAQTVFATSISQALPGYMLSHCINKIHLLATNRDIGAAISTKVADVKSFMNNIDITPYVQAMVFKVENELLKDLTYNNQMDFMLEVRCDLLGETWINVSLNNSPMTPFVTPSFCDALMTPVTTSNLNVLGGLANDFESLVNQLGDSNNAGIAGLAGSFGNI